MTRIKVLVLTLIGVVVLSAGAVAWYWQHQVNAPLRLSEPTLFTVPDGASGHRVMAALRQQQLTEVGKLSGKIWLKVGVDNHSLRAGTYELHPGMTLQDAFRKISRGDEYQFTISLIDGLTFKQWLKRLKDHEHIEFDLNEEKLSALKAQWPWPPANGLTSLEGMFLADTYHFTDQTKASIILQRAMQALQRFVDKHWPQRAAGGPLDNQYDALILASIIEKETAVPAERARIAGVFINRLNTRMRLQTDPTVIYGIGSDYDGNITRAHLRQKTAYNTYVIRGLPPTPIAMAGRPAILAALKPAQTEDLYFVARGDGSHQFSRTLAEHNQAVRKYQLNQ
ncbi:endolytic transglycosylase MltG [Salinimonas lutimaris]|uniref:endolytic transglycosylase MltG n=1 Tax=Salinimonas lutimaris TaxID=914153 RepID=UPI0010BFC693|nr:endolytic transglycosylase MltG [Salinimonas lutimaris]